MSPTWTARTPVPNASTDSRADLEPANRTRNDSSARFVCTGRSRTGCIGSATWSTTRTAARSAPAKAHRSWPHSGTSPSACCALPARPRSPRPCGGVDDTSRPPCASSAGNCSAPSRTGRLGCTRGLRSAFSRPQATPGTRSPSSRAHRTHQEPRCACGTTNAFALERGKSTTLTLPWLRGPRS